MLKRQPQARLLLCAPGNFSADLLSSALLASGVGAGQQRRFVDPRWPPERVSAACEAVPCCIPAVLGTLHRLPFQCLAQLGTGRCAASPGAATALLMQQALTHAGMLQVKEDVRDGGLCFFDESTRTFALPPASALAGLRVVVATCSAAGLLCHGEYAGQAGSLIQRLAFTHVMIDEAGQARLL